MMAAAVRSRPIRDWSEGSKRERFDTDRCDHAAAIRFQDIATMNSAALPKDHLPDDFDVEDYPSLMDFEKEANVA